MPNTYTQIYIQLVFAVKARQSLINKQNREELHKYITGIIQNKGHKMLSVFAMPDHIHILIGLKPNESISDLVREIKINSTHFINNKKWMKGLFNWQEGFGAFSYSKSQINNVINYILNQEEHHSVKSFRDEYIDFLNKFEITYDAKYLFEWVE